MSSPLQLIGRTVLALLVVVGLPQFAHADFIDLVSQSYRIHASGMGQTPGGPVVDYDETSDMPISRYDSVPVYLPNGSQVGLFVLSTAADGGITPASAFVQAQSDLFDLGSASANIAEARAAITFRPLVSNVVVQTSNPFSQWFSGSSGLFDETAGAAVLAFGPFITPAAYNVSLNLEHLYSIYASSSTGPMRGARLSIGSAGPVSAPESESTLTFFFVGLGALLIIARSPKFRPSD
jgi:hypothetical protein